MSLFAGNQTTESPKNTADATEPATFPKRNPAREYASMFVNLATLSGNAIRNDRRIIVNENPKSKATSDRAVSPLLVEYDGIMELKKELLDAVYNGDDLPGLKAYVTEHPEPSVEYWNEISEEKLGKTVVGIETMSAEDALEYGIDYNDEKTWEIHLPVFEDDGVYQLPPALVEEPTQEPEPATETNVEVEDSMSDGDRAAFHKEANPHQSNDMVGEKFGVSGQAVANACKRNFGEDGYEEIKQAGVEARKNNGGFEFGVAADGGEPTPEVEESAEGDDKAADALKMVEAGFTTEQITQILGN